MITTADVKTDVGYSSLTNNTGASNTGIGYEALRDSTTGNFSTAVGREALAANTTGSNTAIGYAALKTVTTGGNNVAVGREALETSTGDLNTAVGYKALEASTTASNNTAVGGFALLANSTGTHNTAHGRSALGAVTTGTYNTAIGYDSGGLITTGAKNTIIGRYDGNEGGLDIRTADNNIVLSDGDGAHKGAYRTDWNSWAWKSGTDGLARHNSGNAVTIANNSTITLTSGELGSALVCVYHTGSGDGGLYFANYRDVTSVQYSSGSYRFNNSAGSTGYNVYKNTFSHTMVYENKTGLNRTVTIAIYGARAR